MKKYFPAIDKPYRFLQSNRSNVLGNLWATFGIDLQSNIGVIRAGRKMAVNKSTTDDADLGLPAAFAYYDSEWWAMCGANLFRTSDIKLTTAFAQDTSTSTPTTCTAACDLVAFNNRLWATSEAALLSKPQSDTWTSRDTLQSGDIHKLVEFKKTARLYYTYDIDTIYSIDTNDVVADSGDYSIALGGSLGNISTMVATSDAIWIGINEVSNGGNPYDTNKGYVLEWDGVSSQVTKVYEIPAAGVVSMLVVNNILYVLDSYGRILAFTGNGFDEIARFPSNGISLLKGAANSSGRFVHMNGMAATPNNTILILASARNDDSGDTINDNNASGIWELDLSNGNLVHKHPLSLKSHSSSTLTDYGQIKVSAVGALMLNNMGDASSSVRSGIICGATLFTNASDAISAILIENTNSANEGQKRAYFVTNWYASDEIDDIWQRLWVTFRRFLNSTDKMVLKYRLEEESATAISITWVNTTSFTTTTDLSAYAPTASGFDGTYGGEVEVLQGTGAGACVHITNIVNNAGTYTVTIDNAVTGVTTGTAKARVQKWIKMLPEVTGQVMSYAEFPISDNNPHIQIKCCMEFTGDNEFHKFVLVGDTQIPAAI